MKGNRVKGNNLHQVRSQYQILSFILISESLEVWHMKTSESPNTNDIALIGSGGVWAPLCSQCLSSTARWRIGTVIVAKVSNGTRRCLDQSSLETGKMTDDEIIQLVSDFVVFSCGWSQNTQDNQHCSTTFKYPQWNKASSFVLETALSSRHWIWICYPITILESNTTRRSPPHGDYMCYIPYLWVLKFGHVGREVESYSIFSTGKCDTPHQQHNKHDQRERGGDVDNLWR